jgi:hypothetical protein
MQTEPQQITPAFAPETQFNVKLLSPPEPVENFEPRMRVRLIAAQERPEWRGIRFSALND